MSNTAQCRNTPEGASGSSTTRTRLASAPAHPDHDNGIGKHQRHGGSPHCPSFTLQIEMRSKAFYEERVMSETTRLRSGLLVFPNLTQLDLTGPYEVLARLPGAEPC